MRHALRPLCHRVTGSDEFDVIDRARGNIAYKGDAIVDFFLGRRRHWSEFYDSERWVIERLMSRRATLGRVLDVGCAVGGLALALAERYPLAAYTGIDINAAAIRAARRQRGITVPHTFFHGDIVTAGSLGEHPFDTVFALHCADWNLDSVGIIEAAWSHVASGGAMVLSLRLTDGKDVTDPEQSFQYIVADDDDHDVAGRERAPYIVFNRARAIDLLSNLDPRPESLLGYGYWGKPSSTARTPLDKILFSVFALTRGEQRPVKPTLDLHLPPP